MLKYTDVQYIDWFNEPNTCNVADESLVKEIISRGLFNRPVRIRLAYSKQTSPNRNELCYLLIR